MHMYPTEPPAFSATITIVVVAPTCYGPMQNYIATFVCLLLGWGIPLRNWTELVLVLWSGFLLCICLLYKAL